jgi:flavin-dependent dehydrogenase
VSAIALIAGEAGWTITVNDQQFETRTLVAADGRNSTVARFCNLLPPVAKERIALQTHIPLPRDFGDRVVLQFVPQGYSGQAPVGSGELNLCLVAKAKEMPALKKWAEEKFTISPQHGWRTITPLTRRSLPAARDRLFLVGDAARVVEPFTGEGIYYALRSGELAAQAVTALGNGANARNTVEQYAAAHRAMYRGRLWVNRLARAAVLSPRISSSILDLARFQPALLRLLTAKIVR